MTRHEIEALLEKRALAIAAHDVDALAELHDEHGELDSPTAGGLVKGRRAIAEVYRAFFNAFPDCVFNTEALVIDGDRIVLVTTTMGTDAGEFLGLPGTGKPFRLPMVHLFTVKDGRFLHERRIYDFTGLLIQIGVLKAKPV